jgi:inorganic pyrophosphatase
MNLKNLPIGESAPTVVHAVIEIPKGSRGKYEYDEKLEMLRLDRVLYSSVHYPAAYGFLPQTLSEDDHALDVIVLTEEDVPMGVLLEVRPIGLLVMKDEEGTNSKVLAVALNDPHFSEMKDVIDVPNHVLIEIQHFFQTYKNLEGKTVKTFGWDPASVAHYAITTAMKRYKERRPGQSATSSGK